MPTSRITAPDGQTYRVTHPEGATDEEILARVAGMGPQQAAAPSIEEQREAAGTGSLQFGIPGLTPVLDTGIETPPWLTETLAGMGRRFSEIGTLGMHETPEQAAALLDDSGYAMAGGVLGDAATLVLGGHLAKSAGWMGQALAAPKTLAQASVGGAAYGGATSNDRVGGALGGAFGGGVGHGVATGLGRLASPHVDDAARALLDEGVDLTPGQILGGSAQRTEDALVSVPFLGDAIKSGQLNSLKQYNLSVINDALEPIGASLDVAIPAGREAIDAAQMRISREYGDILAGMNVRLDPTFLSEIGQLEKMAQKLPAREYRKFINEVNDKVLDPFNNPNQLLLGETFKEVDSGLRGLYKKAQKSSDVYQNDLGDALRSVHQSLMGLAKRQNPEQAARLAATDKAYAKMSRVNEAANYVGAREGIFTPSHLLNSVKRNTGQNQYAAGKGFGQAETEAAKGVLSQTVPDSGTPLRSVVNLGLLGGAGLYNPLAAIGLMGGYGAYTKPGMKAAEAFLTTRPKFAGALRETLEESAPFAGVLGVGIGTNLQ